VDADGHPDIIVGSSNDDTTAVGAGAVFVYSGLTGDLIWSRFGEHAQDHFGWSVDGNGDGHSEVIVGAPFWDNDGAWSAQSGKVYVLDGATGSVTSGVSINSASAFLGQVVRGVGDIDGDGVGDYGFSAPGRDFNGLNDNGYVAVYSGAGTSSCSRRPA
jgi:FG-GAP repeat